MFTVDSHMSKCSGNGKKASAYFWNRQFYII